MVSTGDGVIGRVGFLDLSKPMMNGSFSFAESSIDDEIVGISVVLPTLSRIFCTVDCTILYSWFDVDDGNLGSILCSVPF